MSYYEPGSWNAACSMCGRKRKSSYFVKNWQGQYRCPEHNEPRHPQDYVRGIPAESSPTWVQNPADTFVTICTPNGNTAIADFAVADCAIADYISPAFDPNVID